jgi:hypothetical protein
MAEPSKKDVEPIQDWAELAAKIYDNLTGRNAEITYEFRDMKFDVPTGPGDNASHYRWGVSGALVIRAREVKGTVK